MKAELVGNDLPGGGTALPFWPFPDKSFTRAYIVDSEVLLCVGQDGQLYYPLSRTWFKMGGDMTPELVKEVHCNSVKTSVFILATNGYVISWGVNDYNQLGHPVSHDTYRRGTDANDYEQFLANPAFIHLYRFVKMKALAVGRRFALALSVEGDVYSWGYHKDGQLGHGGVLWKPTPTRISKVAFNNSEVIQIACCESYSVALTEKHELYVWGQNPRDVDYNEEQEKILEPRRLTCNKEFTEIGCSPFTCFALVGNSELYALCFDCDPSKPEDPDDIAPSCGSINYDKDIPTDKATFHFIRIPCLISSILSNAVSDTVNCLGVGGSVLTVKKNRDRDAWVCAVLVGQGQGTLSN